MFPTTQNSASSLAAALVESQIQETTSGAGKAFMKFDFKTGSFSFGRENEDITGEEIVINANSLAHGWVLWVNGSAQKTLVPFNQPIPEQMASVGSDQPSAARAFEAAFLEEGDDTILVFETNSYGGRQGFDSLLSQLKGRALQGETEYLYPLVSLASTSYKHKQGNTIHNPDFKVVAWLDVNGNRQEEVSAIGVDESEETAPVRRRRKA